MNRVFFSFFIFYLLFPILDIMASTEKITYRQWPECYRISNGSTEVIINASAGGRIMVYSQKGVNVIYENPSQDGLLLEDYLRRRFDPDGGRFDYGQERETQHLHSITYMGPWKGEILDSFTVRITSMPDTALGIQSVREFTLDSSSSELRIQQSMINISNRTTHYFFWGRTLLKTGGKIFLPLNPSSLLPHQWGRYIWTTEPESFASDPSDKGISVEGGYFSLLPHLAVNPKYGTDSKEGWMAYGYNGLLFVKTYPYYRDKIYGEKFGLTSVFYTNKHSFVEMEPVSPLASLNPGEEYRYDEKWYLIGYPPANQTDFDPEAASQYCKQIGILPPGFHE